MLAFLNAFSNQLENCFLSSTPIMNVWQPGWPEWPEWPECLYWPYWLWWWVLCSIWCLCSAGDIYYLLRRRAQEVSAAWRWLGVWLPPAAPVPHWQPDRQHSTMCLSRAPDKINVQDTEVVMEEISGSDHPSTEQFNMLLNLLPAHTLQQVRDMDSLR